MIWERRLKIEQIKQAVTNSWEDADSKLVFFTAHIHTARRGMAELIDMIEQKQGATDK